MKYISDLNEKQILLQINLMGSNSLYFVFTEEFKELFGISNNF